MYHIKRRVCKLYHSVDPPPPTRGAEAFGGDDYYFFAVSLTALKWAALGRQRGRVAGGWLAC